MPINYKKSAAGVSNWGTCHRMLIHDLLDMQHIPEVKQLLEFYEINYFDGGYTMALPRLKLMEKRGYKLSKVKAVKTVKKKGKK